MGSTRFPGKTLALLGGIPIIEWVVRRTLRIRGVDHMVLATSRQTADDEIVSVAERLGIDTFRGSHEDVLKRVLDAAAPHEPHAVVRVCADNPFVDPGLVGDLVVEFRREWCDYAFNHRPGLGLEIADGFGAEVFDFNTLRSIPSRFSTPRYHEHLTSPFWEHQAMFKVKAVQAASWLRYPKMRFDVDTPSDLEYLNELVTKGNVNIDSSAAEIIGAAHDL